MIMFVDCRFLFLIPMVKVIYYRVDSRRVYLGDLVQLETSCISQNYIIYPIELMGTRQGLNLFFAW